MVYINKLFLVAFIAFASMTYAGSVDEKYFGVHVLKFHDPKMLPTINYGAVRLWDSGTTWAHIQPEYNKWNWSRLDLAIRGVYKKKDILLTLGMTPQWASRDPGRKSFYGGGRAAMPKNLADWELYVRKVVERYGNRISAIEVWNEPDSSGFFQGSMNELVALTRIVHKVVHSHSYRIKIVSPAFTDMHKLDAYIKAGGTNYVDIIATHLYSYDPYPEAVLAKITALYEELAKHKISKPVWNTESGYNTAEMAHDCHGSDISGAAFVSRWYIQLAANNIQRFYWYAWDHDKLGLITSSGSVKDHNVVTALQQLQRWLINSRVESCQLVGDIWSCGLSRKGKAAAQLVWADRKPTVLRNLSSRYIEQLSGDMYRTNSDINIGLCPILIQSH